MRLLIVICLVSSWFASAQSAFTVYNTSNSELPDNLVNTIFIDEAQNKWIGTQSGLVKIDADNIWTIFNTTNSGLPENDIRSVFVDDENILWVGLFQQGFVRYDGAEWINYNTSNSDLPDDFIRAIHKDANDTMWIGSSGGLTKWDGENFWFTYTISNSDIKSNNITDILIDDSGKKFFGTINGGLTIIEDNVLEYFRTENSDIGDNTVLAISKDIYDNIWMATAFGGLSIYTPEGNFLNFGMTNSNIPDWEVADVAIAEGTMGVLAMNTTGIALYNAIDWEIYNAENSDLPDNYLNTIAVDENNLVWVGTDEAGLITFDYSFMQSFASVEINAPQIFPNPANEYVYFSDTKNTIAEIKIYSTSGTLIKTFSDHHLSSPIEISDMPAGIYTLGITTKKNTCLHLIVVSR